MSKLLKPSKQQIRTWINRQRTLPNHSPVYLEWLRQQYRITCQAEVAKSPNKQPVFLDGTKYTDE